MLDVIVVGAGPIGLFAGYYLGLRKLKSLILESKEVYGGQPLKIYPEKIISDVPGILAVKSKDFIEMLYQQYETFAKDIPIHYQEEIIEIKKLQDSYLVITNKDKYESKTILISSGNGVNIPKKLEVEGVDEKVLYQITDLKSLLNKDVIVLGGGDSALDNANLLKDIAKSVTLIHRRAEFRGHEHSLELFRNSLGNVITSAHIDKIIIENDKHFLLINSTEKIYFDYLVVNYGFLESKNYFSNILNIDTLGIQVKTNMETSFEGVFCVGNACSYYGKTKTLTTGFGEVITAVTAIHQKIYPSKNPTFYSSIK
ncbi:MAG: NAD(P)/FAD-dependent oxidoreductase [Bacillales bacterium]|jgi:thioredoxin reductase (NADPH)|nr:NAD(P)/FAD-dependent oxidoreductase [Bacillales bacterium]